MKDLNNDKVLFEQALKHQDDHKCGAHPFEEYEDLIRILKQFKPRNILEIGSGIGFSTLIINQTLPKISIQTIEMQTDHIQICLEKFKNYPNITLLEGEAKNILPTLAFDNYDLIFFDGYAPQYNFLVEFERIIKKEGILISANCHLKGSTLSTTPQYLEAVNNQLKWTKLEKFGNSLVVKPN